MAASSAFRTSFEATSVNVWSNRKKNGSSISNQNSGALKDVVNIVKKWDLGFVPNDSKKWCHHLAIHRQSFRHTHTHSHLDYHEVLSGASKAYKPNKPSTLPNGHSTIYSPYSTTTQGNTSKLSQLLQVISVSIRLLDTAIAAITLCLDGQITCHQWNMHPESRTAKSPFALPSSWLHCGCNGCLLCLVEVEAAPTKACESVFSQLGYPRLISSSYWRRWNQWEKEIVGWFGYTVYIPM